MEVRNNKAGRGEKNFEEREINFTILLSETESIALANEAARRGVSKAELTRQLMAPVIGERRRIK